ncbi:MAG: WecB/TagA/CpsF family glycosyltransferase, partial [Candidatus Omnitrophica bacterium]|nr:WecB/TagA/CpsF family glycosyltransferase [Candidatus Omnitrophota bacterium]
VYKNLCKMNVPVSIGVGGTFDIIAGKCKLAPNWISRLGLEWFYRLIQEPKRLWKRYLITNTKFLFLFIRELFKNKGETDGGI